MFSRPAVIARCFLAMSTLAVMTFAAPAVAGMQPVATPAATPAIVLGVPLLDAQGNEVGEAQFTESGGQQVAITVTVSGLPTGLHGIHIHQSGSCDPAGDEPFASAGDHFDPTEGSHGGPDNPEAHAGDLGNIVVAEDGVGEFGMTTTKVTLSAGPVSLADADGSALVVHAERDDLETDPSGNSGARVACAVIFAPTGTPEAGTPEATPAS